MQITVNGTRHDVPNAPISYAAVAALAGYQDSREVYIKWNDATGKSGSLTPDEMIEHPNNGLSFRASMTGAA